MWRISTSRRTSPAPAARSVSCRRSGCITDGAPAQRACSSSNGTRPGAFAAISARKGSRPRSTCCWRRRSSPASACSSRRLCFCLGVEGSGTNLAEALADRQRLGVDPDLEQGRLAGAERPFEGGAELLGLLDQLAMGAIGAGQRGKIGVDELGPQNALRIIALLMHANGAVHPVVHDDEDDWQLVLHGGGELLAVHHEA